MSQTNTCLSLVLGVTLAWGAGVFAHRAFAADAPPAPTAAVVAPVAAPVGSPAALAAGQAALKAMVAAYGGDAFLAIKTIQATGTGDLHPPGFGLHVTARTVKLATISPDRAIATLTTALGEVTVASPGGGKDLWYEFDDLVHDVAVDSLIGDPTAILRVAVTKGYAVRDDGMVRDPTAPVSAARADGTAPTPPPMLQSLAIIDGKGHATHVTVDPKTHLLRRVESELETEGTARFDLSDYAPVAGSGGVLLPGTVVSSLNGERILTLKLKDFTLNQPVDERQFIRPAD